MARILWDADVPALAESVTAPLVERYAPLLPRWVEELRIGWGQREDGCPAEMYVAQEYRFARLTLYPPYLSQDESTRDETIRHEILHAALMPMKRLVFRVLEALNVEQDNPGLFRWAAEEARETNEGAVQDLTEGLRRWKAA
jgi:hypothetical protein